MPRSILTNPKYFSYTTISESESSERKILVINEIPFYLSTGTSDDKEELIAPDWRKDLWMPMAGIRTGRKAGQISKLGEYFPLIPFQMELARILQRVFENLISTIGQNAMEECLYSLLLEKYKAPPYNDSNHSSFITLQDIRVGLAGQLTRFGTMEAMISSMQMSPQIWAKNAFLKAFMEHALSLYPQFVFNNMQTLVQEAKKAYEITVNKNDPDTRLLAAFKVNKWLLQEIQASTYGPQKNNNSKTGICLGLGMAIGLSGSCGGLILGGILNVGVLAGTQGILLTGLSTAAACTGFGLIALSLACTALFLYLLWQNYQASLPDDTPEEAITREPIRAFLKNNSSANKPSLFFAHSCQALSRLLTCEPRERHSLRQSL